MKCLSNECFIRWKVVNKLPIFILDFRGKQYFRQMSKYYISLSLIHVCFK